MSEKNSQNSQTIKKILREMEQRLQMELERSSFFSSNLTVTVQNGLIKTRKISIEDCEHFQAQV